MDILITVIVIAAVALLWVMLYDSNRFTVKYHTVEDERIQKACRAVLVTDLHNKRYGKDNEILLAAIREQGPDFILIAGDVLTAKPGASMEPALQFLRAIAGEYPVYYANGNHEHRLKLYPETYGDMAKRYGTALEEMGIRPLVNSHVDLPEYGITVYGAEIASAPFPPHDGNNPKASGLMLLYLKSRYLSEFPADDFMRLGKIHAKLRILMEFTPDRCQLWLYTGRCRSCASRCGRRWTGWRKRFFLQACVRRKCSAGCTRWSMKRKSNPVDSCTR